MQTDTAAIHPEGAICCWEEARIWIRWFHLNKLEFSGDTEATQNTTALEEYKNTARVNSHTASNTQRVYVCSQDPSRLRHWSMTGWYIKSCKDNLVRYRSDIDQVNDFQALDLCLYDSTYHRDRWVARVRRKCEDCCCSNRTTRGRGHN